MTWRYSYQHPVFLFFPPFLLQWRLENFSVWPLWFAWFSDLGFLTDSFSHFYIFVRILDLFIHFFSDFVWSLIQFAKRLCNCILILCHFIFSSLLCMHWIYFFRYTMTVLLCVWLFEILAFAEISKSPRFCSQVSYIECFLCSAWLHIL